VHEQRRLEGAVDVKITVFDYGAGNLHSLVKAVEAAGAEVRVERDAQAAVRDTDALVLPGVGAFGAACESLSRVSGGREAMRDAILEGLPTLGICLGMQLLLDESEEGPGRGLGVVPGHVRRLESRRIPQIGWNAVEDVQADDPLFRAAPLATAYYANSYVCAPAPGSAGDASVVAWSTHDGDRFPAAVRVARAVGVQFHPEKSSRAGVAFVRAWVEEAGR
jgi:glutamine amidotransferase